MDKSILDFQSSVQNSINFLTNIKFHSKEQIIITPLEKDIMEDYYNYYMNGLNDTEQVNIKSEWEYLRIGNQLASIISFPNERYFPEKLSTCYKDIQFSRDNTIFFRNYGDNFSFDLDFNHVYTQIAFLDEPNYHLNNAKKNNILLHKTAKFDKSNEIRATHSDKMLSSLLQNSNENDRLIRMCNNVLIFSDTKEELEKNISDTITKFNEIDLKPIRNYGSNLLAIYEYNYPINSSLFTENHLSVISLSTFSSFLILTGKYKQDGSGCLFNSRLDNTPVFLDLWDEQKKYMNARNGLIIAPTGYGKSFTANHIITSYYSEGVKQVIIDLGGSYRKLAYLFEDDIAYLSFEHGQSLSVNPFILIESDFIYTKDGEKTIITDKLENLTEFIGIHFKRDKTLTEQERASLRKILNYYYLTIKDNHSFLTFIDWFKNNNEEIYTKLNINDGYLDRDTFLLMLGEFIDDGVYNFLYKDISEDFNKNLYNKKIIVFELDKIRDNKLLLSVMLQLISITIEKVIWNDKANKGIIWFDEVAEQLQWEGMLRRLQWFYQAIRKQEGGINIILQAISQLPNNELSNSIIENTQILLILFAKDYNKIVERFNLGKHAFYQMSSLQSKLSGDDGFSELFLLRGERHQVYRLQVSKEVKLTYNTDGKLSEKIYQRFKETGNLKEVIEDLKNEI